MARLTDFVDVLVIGAGQAGLAISYYLQKSRLHSLIVDCHARVGDSWRTRFDSLVLFTPRSYSALPGLLLTGDPDGYPAKDEIADYLESYANHFGLPLALNTGIARLEHLDGAFRATTTDGSVIVAHAVVVATGAFQVPAIPAIASQLADSIVQLTPDAYRHPQQLPTGTVLVVGDGATGRQIARELSATHRVVLSTGRPRRVSPDRVLGKNIFWWLDRLGLLRISRDSRVGQKLIAADPFPGKHLELDRLRERGVTINGRLTDVDGAQVMFSSCEAEVVDAVIWATGYRDKTDWVAILEVIDDGGSFIHRRGVSPVPGLYFIGRSWQWTRGSALLHGVGDDAAFVVRRILAEAEVRLVTAVKMRQTVTV